MYLLCHLAAGLIIGLVLYWIFRDPNLILPAIVGGIASDLIDKPIGHIILKNTLDYGRIYAHGSIFLIITILCGILIWMKYKSLFGISFSIGVFSHQVLDRMWNEPENWLYPFKGPFVTEVYTDYIGNGILIEIFNPYEWIFASLVIIILVLTFSINQIKNNKTIFNIFNIVGFLIAIISGMSGLYLLIFQNNSFGTILTRYSNIIDIHISASVMLLTAIMTCICICRIR